jgi:hypothetical protein
MSKAEQSTSRRRLLKATTALSVLAAPAIARAASFAPSDDRLAALWERWEQTNARALAAVDEGVAERLWRTVDKIENEIIATPATTPAGLRIKILVLVQCHDPVESTDGDMLLSLLADVERLAGGAA